MSPQCKNNQFGRFSVFICIFGRSGLIFGCSGFGRWGGYFRTFGVRGPFSDVRGSDVGGGIFGRSGFGAHFRMFGVWRLGGPFQTFGVYFRMFGVQPRMSENDKPPNSDIRGSGFGVQRMMVNFRTFGVLMFGVQPRTSEMQKHQKPRMSENKS